MPDARHRLRFGALVACAALALHEVRYLLVPGGERPIHAYLPLLAALVACVVVLAAIELGSAVVRARRRGEPATSARTGWGLWPAAAATLLAVHVGQELLEAALAGGPVSPLSSGGWVCLPLALAFGALVTLGLRGAQLAVRAAAVSARARPARRDPGSHRLPAPTPARRVSPLAGHLAGRAPPRAA
jgi:hypothetical protein